MVALASRSAAILKLKVRFFVVVTLVSVAILLNFKMVSSRYTGATTPLADMFMEVCARSDLTILLQTIGALVNKQKYYSVNSHLHKIGNT